MLFSQSALSGFNIDSDFSLNLPIVASRDSLVLPPNSNVFAIMDQEQRELLHIRRRTFPTSRNTLPQLVQRRGGRSKCIIHAVQVRRNNGSKLGFAGDLTGGEDAQPASGYVPCLVIGEAVWVVSSLDVCC